MYLWKLITSHFYMLPLRYGILGTIQIAVYLCVSLFYIKKWHWFMDTFLYCVSWLSTPPIPIRFIVNWNSKSGKWCVFLFVTRYERHFTPNVSLAPSSIPIKSCSEEEDEAEEKELRGEGGATTILTVQPTEAGSRKSSSDTSSKFDGERRGDVMEYDIPTDTDDSSMESPTDSKSIQANTGSLKLM